MRLLITTPAGIAVQRDDVASLRAEDESGGFGVLAGHAEFVTALASSIVGWHRAGGEAEYCAVHRGVLTVTGGETIAVATREAIVGTDVGKLAETVADWFRTKAESERAARSETMRLQLTAIRQIVKYLRPDLQQTTGDGG